jgi:hypothetical protein
MSDLSNKRIGNITSSEIVELTSNGRRDMTDEEIIEYKKENPKGTRKTIDGFGAPFYTYVDECIMERFFKNNLENETEVKAFSWGKLCELIVHDKLPNDYIMQSEITEVHPEISEWAGTPDGKKEVNGICDTITDIKCPLTRKGFYNLIKFLYNFDGLNVSKKENTNGDEIIQLVRNQSKEGEKYFWQLVSNACILGAKYAELIVFMPYFEEIEEIKEYNRTLEKPFWQIENAKDTELPYLYKESGIESINIIRFEVKEEYKIFLTSRVKSALEIINNH